VAVTVVVLKRAASVTVVTLIIIVAAVIIILLAVTVLRYCCRGFARFFAGTQRAVHQNPQHVGSHMVNCFTKSYSLLQGERHASVKNSGSEAYS